jgi:hypothetical protein
MSHWCQLPLSFMLLFSLTCNSLASCLPFHLVCLMELKVIVVLRQSCDVILLSGFKYCNVSLRPECDVKCLFCWV